MIFFIPKRDFSELQVFLNVVQGCGYTSDCRRLSQADRIFIDPSTKKYWAGNMVTSHPKYSGEYFMKHYYSLLFPETTMSNSTLIQLINEEEFTPAFKKKIINAGKQLKASIKELSIERDKLEDELTEINNKISLYADTFSDLEVAYETKNVDKIEMILSIHMKQ